MIRIKTYLSTHGMRIILAVLWIGALVQIFVVISDYGLLWAKRISRTYQWESMERNANFLLGGKGAAFMEFIEDVVPPDGTVVLPDGVGEFSQQNIYEFFLMPRRIPSCLCPQTPIDYSEFCVECLRNPAHYIPAIGEFPKAEELEGYKEFLSYPDDTGWFHGIYIPLNPSTNEYENESHLNDNRIGSAIIDIVILGAIFFLGLIVVAIINNQFHWAAAISLGFPLGGGVLTWFVFLLGWMGTKITLATFIAVYLSLIVLLLVLLVWVNSNVRNYKPPFLMQSLRINPYVHQKKASIAWLLLIILFSLSLVISVGRGYSLFDGIANWALKGYAIAYESSIYAGISWGGHGLAYPQNIHLLISLFKLADGDVLPGSKLIFPFLAFSLVLGAFHFWRKRGVSIESASIGALILFSTPVVFVHSTIGYANLAFSTYLVLGTLWCIDGVIDNNDKSFYPGSLLLGLSAWTRQEGIAISTLVLFILIVYPWRAKKLKPPKPLVILPFIIIAGSWIAFGGKYIAQDQTGHILGGIIDGVSFNVSRIIEITNYSVGKLFDINSWGPLFLLSVIIIVISRLSKSSSPQPYRSLFLLPILSTLIISIFILYNLMGLWHQFDRFMLPTFILVFIFAMISASSREDVSPDKANQ